MFRDLGEQFIRRGYRGQPTERLDDLVDIEDVVEVTWGTLGWIYLVTEKFGLENNQKTCPKKYISRNYLK